jgi:epoxide hydrolase-like predicted phosphatase
MAAKALFFDVGGVLEINLATDWRRRWAQRLRREPDELELLLDSLWSPGATGSRTLTEIERETAEALSLDPAALKELMSDAWAEYLETLNSELAGFVRDLRPRYKTGIISNSFVGARKREQDAYGFEDLCDVVVYSHEVGYLKPDPRIYRVACERVGVLPEEAVLVDDVDANVQGARSIGMTAIKFIDNHQALTELNALLS